MRRIKHVRKQNSGRPTKFIRINDKTMIEVDINIPDDVAKEKYLLKIKDQTPVNRHNDLSEFVQNFFR